MQAKYALKIQVIRSGTQSPRFYVNIPLPVAAAIGLRARETVHWQILTRHELRLRRQRKKTT